MDDDHRDFAPRKSSNQLFTSLVPTAMQTRKMLQLTLARHRPAETCHHSLCCRRSLHASAEAKSQILQAAHGRKKICDYSLERDCLRKYELHCGSRINEHVAGGDVTRARFRGLRSRRASRLDAVGRYRNITSVHINRRKCNTKWRGSSPWP